MSMVDRFSSTSMRRSSVQSELFRPSLQYPSHPYDELLSRTAERFPEQEALIFKDVNLTYRELNALVNAFANALHELGVGRGQKVCLFMTNRTEYLISWFAAARTGATVSPINPSYKEREVAYQLSDSEAVAIVVQQELLPLIEAIRSETPTLKYVITVGSNPLIHSANTLSFSQLVQTHATTPLPGLTQAWEEEIALPYSSGTT